MIFDQLVMAAEECGERVFLRYRERCFTFAEALEECRAMGAALEALGVRSGDRIAVDLPNTPDHVWVLFAADQIGASIFSLNRRLNDVAKSELVAGYGVAATVDETALDRARTPAASGRDLAPGAQAAFAEGDPGRAFITMFTSGTTGRPKAAGLTQANLLANARSANSVLCRHGEGAWQLVLPLYHVGGLQVVIRSLLNRSTILLYERFDPDTVVSDLARLGATHISVVDLILAALIGCGGERLRDYEVILLGGGPVNEATLSRAGDASVYVTYGLTEACSQVATSPLPEYRTRGLELMPEIEVRVFDPDGYGVGEIAVAGPSVFDGYLVPGVQEGRDRSRFEGRFFRTGDRGRLEDRFLHVEERLSDLFVSGGENVYPAEIERELCAISGVAEAAVIGVPTARWGRRPVAFVTAADGVTRLDPREVSGRLDARLSPFQRPDHIFVVDALPRGDLGKVDRGALQALWKSRIEVTAVNVYRIRQPLISPFRNSRVTMTERESLIVEVIDHAGRAGYGEGVAFATPWYTDETVDSTLATLRDVLAPVVLSRAYLHPAEVFDSFSGVEGELMAKGAIEPACWDLFGRIADVSFRELIGGFGQRAPAGVSLGVMPLGETLAEVERWVRKGYRRLKLKIEPGDDVARLRAVRERFPHLMLMADANRGYSSADIAIFQELDGLGLACIEEPIAAASFADLAAFQRKISTPISVDESVRTEADLAGVLAHPELRNINLKIGKFGGVGPSLRLWRLARERGIEVWLGGMFETGVSKYLHAFFETLPGFAIPGDISETRRYFERDIVIPEVVAVDGAIVLPEGAGLGFELDFERMEELLIDKIEVRA